MVIKGDNWKLDEGRAGQVRKQGAVDRDAARVQEEKQLPPASVTTIEKMVAARVAPQAPAEPQQPLPQVAKPDAAVPAKEPADPAKPNNAARPRSEMVQRGAAENRPAETRGDDLRDRHRRFAELTRGPTATATTTSSAAATARPVTAISPSPEVHVGPRPSEPLLREPSRSQGTDPKLAEIAPPIEAHAELRETVPAPFRGPEAPREEPRSEKKAGGEKKGESSSGEARRSAGTSGAGSARGGNLDQLDAGVSADAGGGDQSGVAPEQKLIPLNPDGEEAVRAAALKEKHFSLAQLGAFPQRLQHGAVEISEGAARLGLGIVALSQRIEGDQELREALLKAFLNQESIYG